MSHTNHKFPRAFNYHLEVMLLDFHQEVVVLELVVVFQAVVVLELVVVLQVVAVLHLEMVVLKAMVILLEAILPETTETVLHRTSLLVVLLK